MRAIRWLAVVTLVLTAGVAQAREPATPAIYRPEVPAELLRRTEKVWFGVYMFGKKGGYGSATYGPTEVDGVKAVQMDFFAHIEIKGPGGEATTFVIKGTEAFAFAAPHALLRYAMSQAQDGSTSQLTIERKGDTYTTTVEQAGQKRSLPPVALDYTLGDVLASEIWARTHPKEGASMRRRTFDSDTRTTEITTDRLASISTSLVSGVETTFYEIQSTSEKDGEVSTSRLTADGELISMMLGQMFEMRVEPEALAKQIDAEANVFVLGTTKLNRPLGIQHPKQVKRLVLTIPGNMAEALNGAPGQKATYEPGRDVTELVVGADVKIAAKPDDMKEALQATPSYPLEVAAIQALAKKAVGDAKTPQEKVAALATFVSDFIEDSYSHNAVAVLDLLETRKGDCTEHSALFITLARASGIPARSAGGLMFMGDKILAMGGHAWAEVALDGHWVPVDPTFAEARADAARIAFREGVEAEVWPKLAGKTLIVEDVQVAPLEEGK